MGSDLTGLKKDALIFWRFSLILERWREKSPLLVWVFCFSLKVKNNIKETQIFKCWPWNRGDYGWFWFNDCRDKCKIKSSYTNKLFYTRHNYFRQSNSLQMMQTEGTDVRKVRKQIKEGSTLKRFYQTKLKQNSLGAVIRSLSQSKPLLAGPGQ